MKPIAIAIPLLFLVVQAQAQERRDIAGLSCAEVQALLKQDGTTIIRYRSIFNLSLTRYDLYVSGQKQCGPGGGGYWRRRADDRHGLLPGP